MTGSATDSKAAPLVALPAEAPEPPLLQVKLVDEKVGFSVFASRAFDRGETIYRETIALQATHHPHRKGTRDAYERYCSLPDFRRNAMHGAFPTLAAVNGVEPDDAAGCRQLLGSLIVGGATVDICLTADEHKKMRPPPRTFPWWPRRPNARSETLSMSSERIFYSSPGSLSLQTASGLLTSPACLEWFCRYAFRLLPISTLNQRHDQAGVYLLSSLLNHRYVGSAMSRERSCG